MMVLHLHMPEEDAGAEAKLDVEKFRHGIFLQTPQWSSRELVCSILGVATG